MRVSLCVIVAAVHATRIRRVSPNDIQDSEAEVTYSGSPLDDALTLSPVSGNRSASDSSSSSSSSTSGTVAVTQLQLKPPDDDALTLSQVSGKRSLQLKPPDEQAKPAAEGELEAESEDFSSNPFFHDPAHIPRVNAEARISSSASTASTVSAEGAAGTEFEALLAAAIIEIMAEEKALAKAAHDQVFHHGYYRAVKAETAAKAAVEAAKNGMMKVSHKAKELGRDVVFKKLLEHTKLGRGATVRQFFEHIEEKFQGYVKEVEETCHKHPENAGLTALLEQIKSTVQQVSARKGQEFESEAMSKMMLGLVKLSVKALHSQVKAKHEAGRIQRVFQRGDIPREMSSKMKSEMGLEVFLTHVTLMENQVNGWKENIKVEEDVNAGLKALGLKLTVE